MQTEVRALSLPMDLCHTAFLSLEWEPCLLPGNSASELEQIPQDGSQSALQELTRGLL